VRSSSSAFSLSISGQRERGTNLIVESSHAIRMTRHYGRSRFFGGGGAVGNPHDPHTTTPLGR
jgi:hypothetical protein